MSALVAFEDVSVVAGGVVLLHDVTTVVAENGITVVVGPSGAGKTTLLRLVNRLEVPSSGCVRVRGVDAATLDVLVLRRQFGMVFQRAVPFGGTVLDNLRVADPGLDADAAAQLLSRCALDPGLLLRDADTLSGGEAQRMCIARALAVDPVALLADEPTSSLDPAARDEIEALVLSLARADVPIVWVTHDVAQMRRLADQVIVLEAGEVAYAAAADDVTGGCDAAARLLGGRSDAG